MGGPVKLIPRKRLMTLFSYEPFTGHFIRLVRTAAHAPAGEIAGWPNDLGYGAGGIRCGQVKAHVQTIRKPVVPVNHSRQLLTAR